VYFASMGMVLSFSRILVAARVSREKIVYAAVVVLVCWFSVLTVKRSQVWAGDPAAFYESTLAYHPSNPQLHYNLANVYACQGSFSLSELEYKTALALNPGQARCLSNLCSLYIRWGKHDKAVDACERALAIDPDLAFARENLLQARILQRVPPR
jgi:tetratricopeptide (TPR) repeat protein